MIEATFRQKIRFVASKNHKIRMKRSTLLTIALSAFACVAQAQVPSFSDIGATPPIPGPNDISQLVTTGEIQNNSGNNYYFDNTGQPAGTTFTTGNNAAGYTVTNVIVASFPGNWGNNGTISAGITNSQPFKINFYIITGPAPVGGLQTNAIFIGSYVTSEGTLIPGDFLQFGGLNVTLPPNTICAVTFGRLTTGFGYIAPPLVPPTGATALYPNGSECIINPGGGANAVNYAAATQVNGIYKTNYSTVFDIGMTLNPSALPAGNVLPSFLSVPLPSRQYPGTTAHFTAQTNNVGSATNGFSGGAAVYWQVNTGGGWVNLVDGLQASGSTVVGSLTTNLTIANIGAGDAASYQLVFTNSVIGGPVNITNTPPVLLTLLPAPTAGTFAYAAMALNPVAFWPLNENSQNPAVSGDPYALDPSVGSALAYDVAGGFTGTYGTSAQNGFNGILGPESPAYAGFPSVNYAWGGSGSISNTYITTAASPVFPGTNSSPAYYNLANSSNVTIVAWIYPTVTQQANTAIVMLRNGWNGAGRTDGLVFHSLNRIDYDWDNGSGTTTGFESGLVVPLNTWSMVSLTITPTNATIGLFSTNGAAASTQTLTTRNEPWGSSISIGSDAGGTVVNGGFGGARAFIGNIADVLMYSNSLSTANLVSLFAAGVPNAQFQPVFGALLPGTNLNLYPGVSPTFSLPVSTLAGTVSGYQWQKNTGGGWVNLTDGLQGSGSTLTGSKLISTSAGTPVTSALSIANLAAGDAGSYQLVVTNSPNGTTLNTVSSATIALTVLPALTANGFAAVAVSYGPVAFWPLNDFGNPSDGNAVAYDVAGGFNGVYGVNSQNGVDGILGPESPAYTGFPNPNYAFEPFPAVPNSYVAIPASPTLPTSNTNVTMLAWVYPIGNQANAAGILFDRANGTTTAGIDISVGNQFGYTWDNNLNTTYNYNSGLIVPSNTWNMVACVISPSNTTFYVGTTNGLFSVVQIGDDYGGDGGNGGRAFNGQIADAVMYATNLSANQIGTLFAAGLASGHLLPIIGAQPSSTALFPGRTATFTSQASGLGATTYQWQVNTGSGRVNVVNGNGVSGANTNVLTVGNVGAGNVGSYQVIVTDFLGSVTNATPATLSLAPNNIYTTSTYAQAVTNLNPLAYYRLGEAPGSTVAEDYWGGFAATYGTSGLELGASGPNLTEFPGGGFEINNAGVEFTNTTIYDSIVGASIPLNSQITVPALNLNTNTMTITMWINPNETPSANTALFFSRAAGTVSGFVFDTAGTGHLGYYWNGNTYYSTLAPPAGQWSFVALTIAPDHATLYCYNATSLAQTNNVTANGIQSFGGISTIGNDLYDPTGARQFDGGMDEVAIFNTALTGNQIDALFTAGSAIPVPASIVKPPSAPQYVNLGSTNVSFTVAVTNGTQFFYHWTASGTPLTDGANGYAGTLFSGTATPTLVISNYPAAIAGDTFQVSVTNSLATPSTVPATATVIAPALFPVPAVWTADFVFTNAGNWQYNATPVNIPTGYTGNYGIISEGTYWNALIPPTNEVVGEGGLGDSFAQYTFTNNSALNDAGTIPTGLQLSVGGAPYASGLASYHNEFLDVFIQTYGSPMTFTAIQPGFYNFILYAMDGSFQIGSPGSGGTFTSGATTQGITNDLNIANDTLFQLGQNCTIFTNVLVTNAPYVIAFHDIFNVIDFNGLQVQQVMPIALSIAQTDATHVAVTYSGGTLFGSTSLPGNFAPVGGAPIPAGTVSIPITSTPQFFEVGNLSDGYPVTP
jgi:hypothetical protein